MRKLFSIFVLLLFGLVIYGQDSFLFQNYLDDTANVDINYNMASTHFLGDRVARKMYLFKETYTYVEKGSPMSPGDKVIVSKPSIYYAVRKLNKYFKKELKKGRIAKAEAINSMVDILNKCYSIYHQDTNEFEDYIRSLKHPDDIVAAFDKVELN